MKKGMIAISMIISIALFISGCTDHVDPATSDDLSFTVSLERDVLNITGNMTLQTTIELTNTASKDVRIPEMFDIAVGYFGYSIETPSNSTIYPSLPMAKIDYREITMSSGQKLTETIDIFDYGYFFDTEFENGYEWNQTGNYEIQFSYSGFIDSYDAILSNVAVFRIVR